MAGLRNPTPPQTNSDATSGSSNSNRFSMLQGNKDESESDAATDVAPAGKIAGGSQQGVVATHADSNEATGDVQGQVSEPEVEGGVVPQEEDLQPDEVVSLKEVDFHKAESKQDHSLIRRPNFSCGHRRGIVGTRSHREEEEVGGAFGSNRSAFQ